MTSLDLSGLKELCKQPDYTFLRGARTALPELIASHEALQAEVKELRKIRAGLMKQVLHDHTPPLLKDQPVVPQFENPKD